MRIIELGPYKQMPLFAPADGLDIVLVNPTDKALFVRVRAKSITISHRKQADYGNTRPRLSETDRLRAIAKALPDNRGCPLCAPDPRDPSHFCEFHREKPCD